MNDNTSNSCDIIAEIGLSHEGSLGFAFAFIENAKLSGANFVKFQHHISAFESSKTENFRVDFSEQDKSRWDYWERTSFTIENWKKIIEHCKKFSLEFCVSVFSGQACIEMIDLGVQNIKIGSGDLGNREIADVLRDWNGNLFVSTGLSTMSEIEAAIKNFSKFLSNNRLTIFQCTSKYPTPLNEVGINIMSHFKKSWGAKIGLSDHSNGIDAALAAICHGADTIEKHVTFNKRMFGPDVSSSITFDELAVLSTFRDNYQLIMQPVNKDKIALELENERQIFGRSLGLKKEFKVGEVVREIDFCLRKPAGGLLWEDRVGLIGKKVIRNIQLGELISLKDFEFESK